MGPDCCFPLGEQLSGECLDIFIIINYAMRKGLFVCATARESVADFHVDTRHRSPGGH